MRHGKAAADALAAGLTEFLLELRRIGHAEGRAVDVKGAMAAPAAGVVEGRTQGGADASQQGLQHRQRQTASRFTIGGLAERLVAKVLKSGHGEVAVKNLYHEELNGGNRVEEALAKTIADLAADGGDLPRVENLGKVFLNPPQGDAHRVDHP